MYINQAIDTIVDVYFLQLKLQERFAIELVSAPGMGKTMGVEEAGRRITRKLGQPCLVKSFFLTTVEPPDVRGFGLPGRDTDGAAIMSFTKAPWMPKATDPVHGLIHLDEFGQAQPDVAKPSAELLLNGRVGESQLPITYMVLASSNREKDRSGVGRQLAFIENRKMRLEIEPNLDAWVEWAETNAVNPFAIAFAKVKPGLVFQDCVPDKPGPFCTPRTLCKVAHLIGALPMSTFTEAAAGYIGAGVSAELVSFLRVAEQLPDWEDIIAKPDKVPVPDRPDATYAAMQMVAHRVEAKTANPAFVYLRRMGQEFQVAGLKAVLRRVPQIVQTPEFAHWLRDNKELVMAANIMDRR